MIDLLALTMQIKAGFELFPASQFKRAGQIAEGFIVCELVRGPDDGSLIVAAGSDTIPCAIKMEGDLGAAFVETVCAAVKANSNCATSNEQGAPKRHMTM